nr:chymotrypsin inhibitor-like [Onthophagus taurus]XP_022910519.1 chymotrypsin inhibitor-like [Onthophagus taurus]
MKLFYFMVIFAVLLVSVFAAQNCGPNEEYRTCGSACEPTCAQKNPRACAYKCIPGCYCKSGYLHNSKGQCVKENDC